MIVKELIFYTNQLLALKEFYSGLLGAELLEEMSNSFTINIGKTQLIWEESSISHVYHYAINIPSNQVQAAYEFLSSKGIAILPYKGAEIVDFSSWNAKSIYFYDPAGNIVELIARFNLGIHQEGSFDASMFLSVSEIGLACNDFEPMLNTLQQQLKLSIYDGGLQRFCALGDEEGLFIVVDAGAKKWIPMDDEANPAPFKALIEQEGFSVLLTYNTVFQVLEFN